MKYNWKKWATWLGVAVLLYIIYRIISNRLEAPKAPTAPVVTANAGTVVIPTKFAYDVSKVKRDKTFGIGTNNSQEVAYLQGWLNQWYNAGLKIDGDWGARTTLAFTAHLPGKNSISTTLNSLEI